MAHEEGEHKAFGGEGMMFAGTVTPGWKFSPTDQELVGYYLDRRVHNEPLPCYSVINEVDLYASDIADITSKYASSQQDGRWYFFTARNRKYRKGIRPSRSTPGGFWRACVADTPIKDNTGRVIGVKKTLNFYEGKQTGNPRTATKTSWMMHEYRIDQFQIPKEKGMKLDDAVLCEVYENSSAHRGPGRRNANTTVPQQPLPQLPSPDSCPEQNQTDSPDSIIDEATPTQTSNLDPSSQLIPTPKPLQTAPPSFNFPAHDPFLALLPSIYYEDPAWYTPRQHDSQYLQHDQVQYECNSSSYHNTTRYHPYPSPPDYTANRFVPPPPQSHRATTEITDSWHGMHIDPPRPTLMNSQAFTSYGQRMQYCPTPPNNMTQQSQNMAESSIDQFINYD